MISTEVLLLSRQVLVEKAESCNDEQERIKLYSKIAEIEWQLENPVDMISRIKF